MIKITISSEEASVRIDRLLRKRLPLLSLSDIYSLIRKGGVKVDGKKVKQNHRLNLNEELFINVDESELATSKESPEKGVIDLIKTEFFKRNFHIIFEDQDLLACNKPTGLAVHPGTGHLRHDTLIELAISYMRSKDSPIDPVLVHRIDRDTSGIILLAKNKQALRSIHESFRSGDIEKSYVAVTHNRPPQNEGDIDANLIRNFEGNKTGTKMAVNIDGEGMNAATHYKIVESGDSISRLDVSIETGRTHQIRVHLAHVGAPILGDNRYGDPTLDNSFFEKYGAAKRLYLHAHYLRIVHPITKKKITFTAPVPKEFSALFLR